MQDHVSLEAPGRPLSLTRPHYIPLIYEARPKGHFYLRRSFQDDNNQSPSPKPMTYLDFALPILRTAESIAVGLAFAKAMDCDPEKTQLAFGFRWTKLKERQLVSWTTPRFIPPGLFAYQNEVIAFIEVPLETPLSALGEFVNQAIQPLFRAFDGFELSKDIIENLTHRTIERRL